MDDKKCIEELVGKIDRLESIAYDLIDICLNFGAPKETIMRDTGIDYEEWQSITNGDYGELDESSDR